MGWLVDFFEEENGSAPVESFLAGQPRGPRAKALAIVKLLEEMGSSLPFPYSSQVEGRVRELRTQFGKDMIRILYFGDARRRFILLHGLIKRTDKLGQEDVQIAVKRMEIHNARLTRSRKK